MRSVEVCFVNYNDAKGATDVFSKEGGAEESIFASSCGEHNKNMMLAESRLIELATTATVEYYFLGGSNLVGSGVRHPPHQRQRTTNNVGEGRVVVEGG